MELNIVPQRLNNSYTRLFFNSKNIAYNEDQERALLGVLNY